MNDGSFRNVLKNSQFLFIWIAQIFSQFSDKVLFLFMVVLITKESFSNSAISVLTLVFTIPAVLFGAIAGVFVDRFSKKKIMIISNFFRFLFVAMMLISYEHWYLYLMAFLVSTLTQFFAPAEAAMLPSIIEKKDLIQANTLFTGTILSSVVLGFALGAPVINSYSEKTSGLVISAMYLISMIFILFLNDKNPETEHNIKDKQNFFKEFKEGLIYVLKNNIILLSMIRLIIIFSTFAALSVLIIGFVNDILKLKPVYFGYILATSGIGMGIGSLFTAKTANRIGKTNLIFLGFIMTGLSLIILANTNYFTQILFNTDTSKSKVIFSFIFSILLGFSSSLCVIPLQTILQEITEENMRGKVFGVQNMLVNTAMTVPMSLSGILADKLDGKILNLNGVVIIMSLIGITLILGALIDLFFIKNNRNEKKQLNT
ncbi:MAG: MFS transporter [Candidatus Sericytochromatia bacterium]